MRWVSPRPPRKRCARRRGSARLEAGEPLAGRRGTAPATWVRINAQPVLGPDGTVVGAIGSYGDITESRRADVTVVATVAPAATFKLEL